MSEPLHHIDQLFRDGIGDNATPPPPMAWNAIEQQLDRQGMAELKKKNFFLKRLAAAAVLLLTLSATAFFYFYSNNGTSAPLTSTPAEKNNPAPTPLNRNSVEPSPAKANPSPIAKQELPSVEEKPSNTHETKEQLVSAEKLAEPSRTSSRPLPYKDEAKLALHKTGRKTSTIHKGLNEPNPAPAASHAVGEKADTESLNEATLIAKNTENGKKERSNEKSNAAIETQRSILSRAPMSTLSLTESAGTHALSSAMAPGFLALQSNEALQPIRNAYRGTAKNWGIKAFVSPQQNNQKLAKGVEQHQEDDYRRIKADETINRAYTVGLLADYRFRSGWMIQSGISYSTQTSTIAPQTVFARRDERRGGGPGGGGPGGNSDLRFKLNCAAGYVFLDPKSGQSLNFGDTLSTLKAENTLSYLSIPMQTGYLFRAKKFKWGPIAGITTNILTRSTLQTVLQEGTGTKTPQNTSVNGLKKVYLSASIGALAEYTISGRLSLYVMPNSSFSLSPVNKNTPARTYLQQFNWQAGLRVNL